MKQIIIIMTITVTTVLTGCTDFIRTDPPPTQLLSSSVFEQDQTALSALNGIYSRMASGGTSLWTGQDHLTKVCGLSADELVNLSASADITQFYENGVLGANSTLFSLWADPYQTIYSCNAVLEGATSPQLSPAIKDQLTGEALFIRAFCYFYLVNLFGGVPYLVSTDFETNNRVPRTPEAEIYRLMEQDLGRARQLLPGDFSGTTGERTRPTRWAATALLARVYLYNQGWAAAEREAAALIENEAFTLEELDAVFLKQSREAIWQLWPAAAGYNAADGKYLIISSAAGTASLSPALLDSFEPGDERKAHWTGSQTINGITYHYPYKYKVQSSLALSEYNVMLRLGEQYLVRAEARAMQGDLSGAESDVNAIRRRAGLAAIAQGTLPELLAEIERQRRWELFCEWGHRWLDLRRSGKAGQVLGPVKAGWDERDVYYPVPQSQLLNNPAITEYPQ